MVTLHEVITFLVSMQISISSLQTHNVNRCGRSRHLARKLSLRRKRSSPNVFEMAATETITSIILIKLIRRSEERFSRNAETDLVCRLLLEKQKRCPTAGPWRARGCPSGRGIGSRSTTPPDHRHAASASGQARCSRSEK